MVKALLLHFLLLGRLFTSVQMYLLFRKSCPHPVQMQQTLKSTLRKIMSTSGGNAAHTDFFKFLASKSNTTKKTTEV